jgi:hypothetical protein
VLVERVGDAAAGYVARARRGRPTTSTACTHLETLLAAHARLPVGLPRCDVDDVVDDYDFSATLRAVAAARGGAGPSRAGPRAAL